MRGGRKGGCGKSILSEMSMPLTCLCTSSQAPNGDAQGQQFRGINAHRLIKKDQVLGQILGNRKSGDLRTRERRARGKLWSQRPWCSSSHELWKVEVGVPLFLKSRAILHWLWYFSCWLSLWLLDPSMLKAASVSFPWE